MNTPALIDTNVSLGHWPWMDFTGLTASVLEARLASHGIEQAWVCAADSILFPDPDVTDDRLVSALSPSSRLMPVKTVNPLLGNWRESLSRALGPLGLRLVKIYPNYHRYSLLGPAVVELAARLSREDVPLLIALRVEDERNQYPLMRASPVPVGEIVSLAATHPRLRVLVLGATAGEIAALTAGAPNVSCDISYAETGNIMDRLLSSTSASRLVFGSHTPFFYTQAAVRKLTAASLHEEVRDAIAVENAKALLGSPA